MNKDILCYEHCSCNQLSMDNVTAAPYLVSVSFCRLLLGTYCTICDSLVFHRPPYLAVDVEQARSLVVSQLVPVESAVSSE